MLKRDFDYLRELVQDFFSQPYISDKLQLISDIDITGWEIWFQVEFSFFLKQHSSKVDWKREHKIPFDLRKEKSKKNMCIDFFIRKKGWKKDHYLLLEVKQHKDAGTCMNAMLDDLIKLNKMRPTNLQEARSFWMLGIFSKNIEQSIEDINQKLQDRLTKREISLNPDMILISEIEKTNYTFLIL